MRNNQSGLAWRRVLLASDHHAQLGPYPAGHTDGEPQTARFSYQVLERMHLDTRPRAEHFGHLIITSNGKVWQAKRHNGKTVNRQRITADPEGLFTVGQPVARWQIVEILRERQHECECRHCKCPDICAICEEPVGSAHAEHCPWLHGSAPWEFPDIAPSPEVLADQRHWAGCPYTRRRPGQLFGGSPCSLTGKPVCSFCGTAGTRLSHTLATDGRFEHHEYCRECRQVWHAIAA